MSNSIFNLTFGCHVRYWTGAVWWYKSAAEAPSIGAARTGVKLEAGVVRGRTVGTGQLLLALDSGALQLLNLCTEEHEFKVQSVQGSSYSPRTRGPSSSSTSAQSSMSLRYSRYRAAPTRPGLRGPPAPQPLHRAA
jgi:hypothetical protein